MEKDAKMLGELGYPMIEIVACNLYPFAEASNQQPPLNDADLLEMVDIGDQQWFEPQPKITEMS